MVKEKKEAPSICELGLRWIADNTVPERGIVVSHKKRVPYPEVTGYLIPTLYQWGQKGLARDFAIWLTHQQNRDGSFSAIDGTPYTFDTGQVIRGFVAASEDLPEIEEPLRRACDWVLTQVRADSGLATPSTRMWGGIADDRIHLYVLPPLIEAGRKLNNAGYVETARRILNRYLNRGDLSEFNTLSHFYGYIIEAVCDLGKSGLAESAMSQVAVLQREDGSIPAYRDASWVCLPGLAQFAIIGYKLKMWEFADKAMECLGKAQNRTGGFYGSYGEGAGYFPEEEISWAVKFFLDAYFWKIRTAFDRKSTEIDKFSGSIDENDGRPKELLSFFGDMNGKRVIDIGCGKGRFIRILKEKFPSARFYGLDISEGMLAFCPPGIEKMCGSMLDIRYPDGYFDCVYCVEALEHAVRVEDAIKEMTRVLKPGGKIVIIDKDISALGRLKTEDWEQWFEPEGITSLLCRYGVQAGHNHIAYDKFIQPDGLFIAWKGVKND